MGQLWPERSPDGERWRFVRHFAMHVAEVPLIGFEAQPPHRRGLPS